MVKLLVVLVILLAVVAIAQLARVYEVSSVLRKKKEEDISNRDNKMNAGLMLLFGIVFFASFIYLMYKYGSGGLPIAGTYHGEVLDTMFTFNWVILIVVFFITHILLFWFSFKYYYRKDRKAHWFPHDNKLELLWTVVPACVLAVVIIYGLRTWQDITNNDVSEDANPLRVELYAKQFDWTARYGGIDTAAYAGTDSIQYLDLGNANFLMITGTNPLGLITPDAVESSLEYYQDEIEKMELQLAVNDSLDKYSEMAMALTSAKIRNSYIDFSHGDGHDDDTHATEEHSDGHGGMSVESHEPGSGHGAGDGSGTGSGDKTGDGHGAVHGDAHAVGYHFNYDGVDDHKIEALMHLASEKIAEYKKGILSEPARIAKEERLGKFQRFRGRLIQTQLRVGNGEFKNASDDILVKGEFWLPKDKEVDMIFRSRDVIHSAYFPHFRVQMNCVPGITTPFRFTPSYTTEEMREITGDPEFDYILLCNKICGASHFNMFVTVKVVEQPEFDQWLKDKNNSDKRFEPIAEVEAETTETVAEVEEPAVVVIEGEESH